MTDYNHDIFQHQEYSNSISFQMQQTLCELVQRYQHLLKASIYLFGSLYSVISPIIVSPIGPYFHVSTCFARAPRLNENVSYTVHKHALLWPNVFPASAAGTETNQTLHGLCASNAWPVCLRCMACVPPMHGLCAYDHVISINTCTYHVSNTCRLFVKGFMT
jgi:hypothetical protein